MTWREICSQGVRSATMPQPLLQLETIFSRTIHLFFLSSFSLKSSQTQKIDWSICFYPFFVSRRLEYWLRLQNRPTEFLVSPSLDSGKKYFWAIRSGHTLVPVFKVEFVLRIIDMIVYIVSKIPSMRLSSQSNYGVYFSGQRLLFSKVGLILGNWVVIVVIKYNKEKNKIIISGHQERNFCSIASASKTWTNSSR